MCQQQIFCLSRCLPASWIQDFACRRVVHLVFINIGKNIVQLYKRMMGQTNGNIMFKSGCPSPIENRVLEVKDQLKQNLCSGFILLFCT